jgi:hypothetical protein
MSILKSAAASRALRIGAALGVAGTVVVGLGAQSASAAAQSLKLSSATGGENSSVVLTVTGKGFIDATGTVVVSTVEFQTAACGAQGANSAAAATAKAIISDTRMVVTTPNTLATSPSGTKTDFYLCAYDGAGTPALVGSAKYTVYAAPAITAVISPISGPATGGGNVTITGTGFTSKSTVKFGTVASPKVTVNTAGTTILAAIPAQAATGSAVAVSVSTEGGPNPTPGTATWDDFTYQNAVTVSPHFGKNATTTTIDVTGLGFSTGLTNAFGAVAGKAAVAFASTKWTPATHGPTGTAPAALCQNPQLVSDTEIVCDTPSNISDGSFFVTVVNDIDKTKTFAQSGASLASGSAAFTFAAF